MVEPPYYLWNQWYLVGRIPDLRRGRTASITVMDVRIALYRDTTGRVVALEDRCPHVGAQLSLGKVQGDCLSCPFHGWTFDQAGACVDIPSMGAPTPALRNLTVRSFPVHEAAGLLWLFMRSDASIEPDEPAPVPPELLDPAWAWTLVEDTWDVNFTRFAENMMDQVHVPFVHARTIGRGASTRGPLELEIREVPGGFDLQGGMLTFRMPNIHRLYIFDRMGIGMHGLPVSANRTRIFIFGFRKFLKPRIFDFMFRIANRRILEEDRAVLLSQRPTHIDLTPGGDHLVRADVAARAYRRLLVDHIERQQARAAGGSLTVDPEKVS
ncbi:MAG: aromatic ring-hydroxylating dioxygenase subunit alpha [bacterium]|nr:aromatic ring-hydroxylating dioxygenase subunit alpha [bacterium]